MKQKALRFAFLGDVMQLHDTRGEGWCFWWNFAVRSRLSLRGSVVCAFQGELQAENVERAELFDLGRLCGWFVDFKKLVCLNIFEQLHGTAGPANLDRGRLGGAAKAEVNALVV